MDISTNLAFTIIICVTIICITISCFTVIIWQIMKYLINRNKTKQKISKIKKIKSFRYPVWIYKGATTTNNDKSVNDESIDNESK